MSGHSWEEIGGRPLGGGLSNQTPGSDWRVGPMSRSWGRAHLRPARPLPGAALSLPGDGVGGGRAGGGRHRQPQDPEPREKGRKRAGYPQAQSAGYRARPDSGEQLGASQTPSRSVI